MCVKLRRRKSRGCAEIVAEWAGNIIDESLCDRDKFMEWIHIPKLKLKVNLLNILNELMFLGISDYIGLFLSENSRIFVVFMDFFIMNEMPQQIVQFSIESNT